MANVKVYEYAKEIGMETLALMDRIREWKLPIKSHMAELSPTLIEEIQTRLKGGHQEPESKKTTKKKAVKKTSTKSADGGEKKKVKAPAKTAVKKVATAHKGDPQPPRKTSAKTVIRRRAGEASEEEAPAAVVAAAPKPAPQAAPVVREEVPQTREKMLAAAEALFANRKAPEEAPPVEVKAPEELAVAAPVAVAPRIVETPSAPAMPVVEVAPAPEPAPVEAKTTEPEGDKHAPRRGKREVLMTPKGPTSGVRSDAPRTNIVGRMDLSRVTPPPGATGYNRGPRPQGPGGPRNIRPGFVAQTPAPVNPEEEAENRRRFEDRAARRRPGSTGGGTAPASANPAAARELPEVAAFSAAEFRKREMVFQPKKKKGSLNREALKTTITTPKASKRVVRMDNSMSVGEFSQAMGVKAPQVIKHLVTNGIMATITTNLDFDTAALVAPEFGFEVVNIHRSADELLNENVFGDVNAELVERPPVVTVMGHVDHGKTTLLDAIRNADVAAKEAGGITQHIGAYQVTIPNGKQITFIDTPGHEAFTAMRARGANVTDIVIIVVAADDGLMPQTAEAINHAKAAGVPIIVAINKMDRPNANPDRIKQQLTEFQLVPEEWGGSTIFCPVSALKKTGIDTLLEQIQLVAEVAELKANPHRNGTGVVIESRLERGRGPVATVLVKDGSLAIGQSIVAGAVSGRIRSMVNDRGEQMKTAGPSQPVEILGLSAPALAGDRFDVAENEQMAEQIAEVRKKEQAGPTDTPNTKMSLEAIFSKMQQGDLKELPVVLKADVAGSVEAIKGMFDKLATPDVRLKIIHSAVGGVNESDVLLASTAKGLIIGFNVRPDSGAAALAKQRGIEIKTFTIVYELMDQMKLAMQGLLTPELVERSMGRAEVRNIFTVPKVGTIAGSAVVDGKITRSSRARLVRDGRIIYEGNITSLKRFKDDVKEVLSGYECGIGIENYNDIKVGDVIEAFSTESVARELSV